MNAEMLSFMRWLQAWHAPWWDGAMVVYSDLYGKPVFILAALTYWWWPRSQARWLMVLTCGGQWLNSVLKFLVGTVRPAGEGLRHLRANAGTGPSFPSGHTQGVTVVLGAVALMKQRRWLFWLAAAAALLMAYSRMYTGYHWPIDVVGGVAIGVVLLGLWFQLAGRKVTTAALADRGAATVQRRTWLWIAASLAVPALLSVAVHPYGLVPSTDEESTRNALTVLGLVAGYLAGSFAEEAWVGFDPSAGRRGWQWLKLPVGAAVTGAAFFGGEVLLGGDGLSRYVRYAVDGWMSTCLVPWIFVASLRRFGRRREA